jgi:DnaK suppressor protein
MARAGSVILEGVLTVSFTSRKMRDYKERLLQQKTLLERSALLAVEQGRESVTEDALDSTDRAVLSYEREFIFTRGTHDHGQLAQVRRALERMKEGTFGECAECGTEIGAKRLEAVPWTRYCIACQEKAERGEILHEGQAA